MNRSTARFVGACALGAWLAAIPARANAPVGRYTQQPGGIVVDNKTGLTWQQATAPGTYTYQMALSYCSSNMAMLPGSGWHLPEIKQLETLVDDGATSAPTIDTGNFPSTQANLYWSSTTYAPSPTSIAWIVTFTSGHTFANAMSNADYVRCVR